MQSWSVAYYWHWTIHQSRSPPVAESAASLAGRNSYQLVDMSGSYAGCFEGLNIAEPGAERIELADPGCVHSFASSPHSALRYFAQDMVFEHLELQPVACAWQQIGVLSDISTV